MGPIHVHAFTLTPPALFLFHVVCDISYVAYAFACQTRVDAILILVAIVTGIASSMIWTSSGVCLTALSSDANRGRNSAIMIGFIRCAPILANIVAGYLINAKTEDDTAEFEPATIFLLLSMLGCVGIAGFLFLKRRMIIVDGILAARAAETARIEAAAIARTDTALPSPCSSNTDSPTRGGHDSEQLMAADDDEPSSSSAAIQSPIPMHAHFDITMLAEDATTSEETELAQQLTLDDEPSDLAFASPASPSPPPSSGPVTIVTPPTGLDRLLEIFRLLIGSHGRYLLPIMLLLQGAGSGFFFGTFSVTMGKSFLGYSQSAMGCTAVASIFGMGRLLDRLKSPHDKKKLFFITMSAHLVFVILVTAATVHSDGFTSRDSGANLPRTISEGGFAALVYLSCLVFGLAWGGTDVCVIYFLGQIFADSKSEIAFAAKAFCDATGFFLAQILLLAVGPICYPIVIICAVLPIAVWLKSWKLPSELLTKR